MPPLATDLFDHALPPHLVAQTPAVRRDQSRLLVVDRSTHSVTHHTFADLPRFLRAGDTLFRNNATVLPARLHARRPTGGQVECLLLRPVDGERLRRCLIKPGKKLPVGATFAQAHGAFAGEIVSKNDDGSAVVRLTTPNEPAFYNRSRKYAWRRIYGPASDPSPSRLTERPVKHLPPQQLLRANVATNTRSPRNFQPAVPIGQSIAGGPVIVT